MADFAQYFRKNKSLTGWKSIQKAKDEKSTRA